MAIAWKGSDLSGGEIGQAELCRCRVRPTENIGMGGEILLSKNCEGDTGSG